MLSVARKMCVYLAVPGEVLATALLSDVMQEMQETTATHSNSTESEGTAAAASSFKARRKNKKQQRFYKNIDLMILRR